MEALPARPNPAGLTSEEINELLSGITDPEIFELTCGMIERGELLPYSQIPQYEVPEQPEYVPF